MNERNKWEKPRAFILHDSRDKTCMAEPLANELKKLMCPVWYDQFSLRIGDSLRESIERGPGECSNCILIPTPNFLSSEGWSREYDSIFTREIDEEQRVILAVWDDVSIGDVSEFSPILADCAAVQWSAGAIGRSQKNISVYRRLKQTLAAAIIDYRACAYWFRSTISPIFKINSDLLVSHVALGN